MNLQKLAHLNTHQHALGYWMIYTEDYYIILSMEHSMKKENGIIKTRTTVKRCYEKTAKSERTKEKRKSRKKKS